jgi:hypothetical protein
VIGSVVEGDDDDDDNDDDDDDDENNHARNLAAVEGDATRAAFSFLFYLLALDETRPPSDSREKTLAAGSA